MRLWSMVVIHPHTPWVCVGRLSSVGSPVGGGGASEGSRTVAIRRRLQSRRGVRSTWSLQCVQVGDQLGDLAFGELEVGHLRPRLLARRVAQPLAQVGV